MSSKLELVSAEWETHWTNSNDDNNNNNNDNNNNNVDQQGRPPNVEQWRLEHIENLLFY